MRKDIKMDKIFNMKPIPFIKSKGEAQSIAIEWQRWQSTKSMSYLEMAVYHGYFMLIGKKFNLMREFKENGII